jgi:hypothetical protein
MMHGIENVLGRRYGNMPPEVAIGILVVFGLIYLVIYLVKSAAKAAAEAKTPQQHEADQAIRRLLIYIGLVSGRPPAVHAIDTQLMHLKQRAIDHREVEQVRAQVDVDAACRAVVVTNDPGRCRTLLIALRDVAQADGPADQHEQGALQRIAQGLGLPYTAYQEVMAPPPAYAAYTPPAAAAGGFQSPFCSTCGGPSRWVPESAAWGCDRCRRLVTPAAR